MKYISVENLSFKYSDKVIFNNVNFDIKKGEFVGILGSNCSGKTTLLNLI